MNLVTNGTFNLGQTFTLFTGGNTASTPSNFSSINGSPGSGLAWSFTNGVLSVVVSVTPVPTNISYSITGNQLVLNWPVGQGWRLQAQTNNLATGLTATWSDVTPTPAPPYTNMVSPANPTVFYRLVYP